MIGMLEDLLSSERGKAFLPSESQVPVMMILDRAAEAAARDLRALQVAFEGVCEARARSSPEALLALWAPQVGAAMKRSQEWLRDLDADPATVERFRSSLDQAWTLGGD